MSGDCDFGLIGLAVMGENLALNVESRGYKVAVYNRTTEKVDDLIKGRAAGQELCGHALDRRIRQVSQAASQAHAAGQSGARCRRNH